MHVVVVGATGNVGSADRRNMAVQYHRNVPSLRLTMWHSAVGSPYQTTDSV